MLLEKNVLSKRVEETVAHTSEKGSSRPTQLNTDQAVWQLELSHLLVNETKKKLAEIKQNGDQIRQESVRLRERIATLETKIAEKQKTFTVVQEYVPQRRKAVLVAGSSMNSKAFSSFSKLQQTGIESRAQLCREAASLMRLRQRRRRGDASTRDQFSIAGLTLPDLREVSNLRCADLTAVLGSVAHLTLLVGFYLGVRLPAEITEPHPDYPSHTIFTPAGSYRGGKYKFAEVLSSISQPISPSSSTHEQGQSLQPRPLFIVSADRDDRVFKFQKRDEQAFRYLTEGIALLAWDIAWLCRSQGFTVGTTSWEDICNIGRNLHQLLIAVPQAPSISRIHSDRLLQKRPISSRRGTSLANDVRREAIGRLGQNSDLFATSQGTKSVQRDLLSLWDYVSWWKISIPLRKTLLTEITSAEWELLLDEEWDDGGEQFDEAVLVKSRGMNGHQYDDARSIVTTRTRNEDEAARVPGTSGWTKLKSRGEPA